VLEPDGTPATGVLFSESVAEQVEMALGERQVGDGLYDLDLPVGPHRIDVYRIGAWSERIDVEVSEGATVEKVVRSGRR
jgi:hypothetical protein